MTKKRFLQCLSQGFTRALIAALCVFGAIACGQKGPLKLPTNPDQVEQPHNPSAPSNT